MHHSTGYHAVVMRPETEQNEPIVSIVVVAREGFRIALDCLDQLLRLTPQPFRLIYVDVNSPRRIGRAIERRVRDCGGTLLRTDTFIRPTQARNLGLREVDTPYTLFIDNNVRVSPGWLEPLLTTIEAEAAAFVSPLILEGPAASKVHFAGAEHRIEENDEGRRYLVEDLRHTGRRPEDVMSEAPQPTMMLEFHAVLIQTQVLRDLGGLDEACSTAFEHNDLSLSITGIGGTGWIVPASVVEYVSDRAGAPSNLIYHALRWSRPWVEESLTAFCTKWGLSPDDPVLIRDLRFVNARRRKPLHYIRGAIRRTAGRGLVSRFDRLSDWLIEKTFARTLAPQEVRAGYVNSSPDRGH
jgi:GT2 family glycosyltransferase